MKKQALDYLSPLPPLKSGISDYSKELVKELSKYYNITAYTKDQPKIKIPKVEIKKYKENLKNKRKIYNIGNSINHTYIYKELLKNPGLTILHDLNLYGLFNGVKKEEGSRKLEFLKNWIKENGLISIADLIHLILIKPAKKVKIKKHLGKKENYAFIDENWNSEEIEKNGIHYRWSKRNSGFIIKDGEIKTIMISLSTDHKAKLKIKINKEEKIWLIKPSKGKYEWIKFDIKPSTTIKGKIKISKPLGIISNIVNGDFRDMGIKVAEIRYYTEKNAKNIDLFKIYSDLVEEEARPLPNL